MPRAGARVTRGQVIFTLFAIQPPDRDLDVEAARDAATAEAELMLATQRVARLERLLADGAASARAVEEARAQQKVAAANAAAARARAKEIGSSPTGTGAGMAVRAPIAGVLQSVSAAPGQTVAASAPLFEVVQTDGCGCACRCSSASATVSTRASRSRSTGSASERSGAHRVAGRGPAIGGSARRRRAICSTRCSRRRAAVRPGERVSVRLPLTGAEQALVVPDARPWSTT